MDAAKKKSAKKSLDVVIFVLSIREKEKEPKSERVFSSGC